MEETYDSGLFPTKDQFTQESTAWNNAAVERQKELERTRPVGTFQTRIAGASLGRSSSSNLQITYALEILAGESKGIVINKYDSLRDSASTDRAQQELAKLGIDAQDIPFEKLPATLLSLQGKCVQVKTLRNGNFYNIYFQRLITSIVDDSDQLPGLETF